MAKKKYAAASALLVIALFSGVLFTACGDDASIAVSNAQGIVHPDSQDCTTTDILQPTESDDAPQTEKDNSASMPTGQPSAVPSSAVGSRDKDDSYFDDALFIGDSLTEGFQLHGGINNATYYGFKNLNINEVFEKSLVKSGGQKITIAAAIKNHSFGKYYIMLGANELGWVYPEIFITRYGTLIDLLREENPNATIYLQSILPVTSAASTKSKIYSNDRINQFNKLISDLAADKNVTYLNVRESVENKDGILPNDAARDGVHLNKDYCIKWANYLRDHK